MSRRFPPSGRVRSDALLSVPVLEMAGRSKPAPNPFGPAPEPIGARRRYRLLSVRRAATMR